MRQDAVHRQEQVKRLRRQVLAGDYHVEAGAVAAAILLEGDLLLH